MSNIIWRGTADVDGYEHPMRVIENDGRLMTEWASDSGNDAGSRIFDDSTWYADYQKRFREMRPEPSDEIRVRMISDGLLDA